MMRVRGPKSGFRRTIPSRRKLRRYATPAEKLFWAHVTDRQFLNLKFRRQHGVGKYIIDFYCPEKKLAIEIDSDTHAGLEQDATRTAYLESLGYHVIRYHNRDIMQNVDGVFEDLIQKLESL